MDTLMTMVSRKALGIFLQRSAPLTQTGFCLSSNNIAANDPTYCCIASFTHQPIFDYGRYGINISAVRLE
jgi:hypothetical protein